MEYSQNDVLLAFDASTVTIGWALFNINSKKLIDFNYYKYKKETLVERAVEAEDFISDLTLKYYPLKIKVFAIEERLKSFRAGGTNSDAMLKTAALNFSIQIIFHKLGITTKEVSVQTSRRLCFPNFHSIARKIKNKKQKEVAFEFALVELGHDKFPKKLMKSGKRKGENVFLEEAKDMADAYILGKSTLIILGV